MKPQLPLLLSVLLLVPTVEAQGGQYLGPGLRPSPVPPGATKGRPNRPSGQAAQVTPKFDPTRWEAWWAYNREDLLAARGLADDAQLATTDTLIGRSQTPAEARARVLPVIRGLMDDRSSDVRGAACIALGRNGDPKDIPLLVARVSDRDRNVAACALLGLGLMRHPDADAALQKALADENRNSKERSVGLLALGLSGTDGAAAILGTQPVAEPISGTSATSKANFGHAVGALAYGLWSNGDLGSADRAPMVSGTLRAAFEKAAPSDETLRSHFVTATGKVRDPSARGFLVALLKDATAGVRRAAATALSRCVKSDDPESADALIAAITREPDPEARHAMALALGRVAVQTGPGADRAYTTLVAEAAKQERQHRAFALIGLGLSKRKEASSVLRAAFEETNDETLRGAAATALGILGDTGAWPLIQAKIAKRGNPTLISHLLNYVALTRHPAGLKETFALLKDTKDPDVVATAAFTLGVAGYAEAGPTLVTMLAKTSVPEIRGATAAAIGRLGDRRLIESLVTTLDEVKGREESKAATLAALGLITGKTPLLNMTRAVIDADPGARIDSLDFLLDLL